MNTELVEEVDVDGSVLRVVTRAEMRAEHLRHRLGVVGRLRKLGQVRVIAVADDEGNADVAREDGGSPGIVSLRRG